MPSDFGMSQMKFPKSDGVSFMKKFACAGG